MRYCLLVNDSEECFNTLVSLIAGGAGKNNDEIVDGAFWLTTLCIIDMIWYFAMSSSLRTFSFANIGPVWANLGWSAMILTIFFKVVYTFLPSN